MGRWNIHRGWSDSSHDEINMQYTFFVGKFLSNMVNGVFDDEGFMPLDLLIISTPSFWYASDINIAYNEQRLSYILFELCSN